MPDWDSNTEPAATTRLYRDNILPLLLSNKLRPVARLNVYCHGMRLDRNGNFPYIHITSGANADIDQSAEDLKDEQLKIFDRMTSIAGRCVSPSRFQRQRWKRSCVIEARSKRALPTEQFYVEVNKMIVELGDEHSFYLSPNRRSYRSNYAATADVGVGICSPAGGKTRQTFTVISTFRSLAARHPAA